MNSYLQQAVLHAEPGCPPGMCWLYRMIVSTIHSHDRGSRERHTTTIPASHLPRRHNTGGNPPVYMFTLEPVEHYCGHSLPLVEWSGKIL